MVQAWKCTSFPPCDDETLHRLIEDYGRLPPYPYEALPEELKRIIYRLEQDTSLSMAASPQPTRPPTTPGPPRTPSELGPEIAPTMPHSTPSACATSTPISEPTSAHESSAAATPLAALATAAVLTLVLVTLLKRPKGG